MDKPVALWDKPLGFRGGKTVQKTTVTLDEPINAVNESKMR